MAKKLLAIGACFCVVALAGCGMSRNSSTQGGNGQDVAGSTKMTPETKSLVDQATKNPQAMSPADQARMMNLPQDQRTLALQQAMRGHNTPKSSLGAP